MVLSFTALISNESSLIAEVIVGLESQLEQSEMANQSEEVEDVKKEGGGRAGMDIQQYST